MAGIGQKWGFQLRDILFERYKEERCVFRMDIPLLTFWPDGSQINKLPIMGVSGAGKSTLMNMLAAIEWPQSTRSDVEWTFPDGFSIAWGAKGPDPDKMAYLRQRYFGFAFQDSTLIPHLTIEDNLCYPLTLRGSSHSQACQKAASVLAEVVDASNTASFLRRYPHELSGGERQRVALAQSRIHDPTVLFADEPTGNLDPTTKQTVMQVLTEWVDAAPRERLLIWVTHHARDPQDQGVELRLDVSNGSCQWQFWNAASDSWKILDGDN